MAEVRHAFILRLWFKPEGTAKPSLRGSLQAAHSDQVYYFASLEEIPDLLQQFMHWQRGASAPPQIEGKEE